MSKFITALDVLFALVIVWRTLCNINQMTRATSHVIRVVNILLAVGAAGVVLAPLYEHEISDWMHTIVLAGFATLMVLNRRVERNRERRDNRRAPRWL